MRAEGIALVTGAGRGLGRAIALELCARGFEVHATARRLETVEAVRREAPPGAGRIRSVRLDVTDPDSIQIPDGLRVLVNNAGLEPAYLPVEHAPREAWRAIFETNVFGVLEVTRRALPKLRRAGGGVVCNVTSAATVVPMPFYAAYRASKAAVSALGESLQAEAGPFGLRVLEVMPGPIATQMLEDSDRALPAEAYPEYRDLAQRARQGRQSVEASTTRADVAARNIADAILDDDAPLRMGCDSLGAGLLEAWRAADDERWQRDFMAGLGSTRVPPREPSCG